MLPAWNRQPERVAEDAAKAVETPLAARERLLQYELPPLVLPGATAPPNPTEEVHMALDRLTVAIFHAETAIKAVEQRLIPPGDSMPGRNKRRMPGAMLKPL